MACHSNQILQIDKFKNLGEPLKRIQLFFWDAVEIFCIVLLIVKFIFENVTVQVNLTEIYNCLFWATETMNTKKNFV